MKKLTTKRLSSGEYQVFSDGIFCGTISKLAPEVRELIAYYGDDEAAYGQWAAFDRSENWLGSTNTKKGGLKWLFVDYR